MEEDRDGGTDLEGQRVDEDGTETGFEAETKLRECLECEVSVGIGL